MFHVSKSYSAGSFALRDVSLEVGRGEFVFLTGPSGAGKTTLLKLLFAAERPSEGQIVVLGRNIARLGERAIPELRRRIGVVFQDFKLLPGARWRRTWRLALDVVGTPPRVRRAPRSSRSSSSWASSTAATTTRSRSRAASSSASPSPARW